MYAAELKCRLMDILCRNDTQWRLTVSNPRPQGSSDTVPWNKVVIRPITLQEGRRLQFACHGPRKVTTRNVPPARVGTELNRVLQQPFTTFHVQSADADTYFRISRKGKLLTSRAASSLPADAKDAAHDHRKKRPLAAGRADDFLVQLGIMNEQGQVRPFMKGKFRQINQFIHLFEPQIRSATPPPEPLHIVDCGCGKAYLTFAVYHHLVHSLGWPVSVTGIDHNAELIESCLELQDALGWEHLAFKRTTIADFKPGAAPDVVLSLHACDTATDDAIAAAVRWKSGHIFAAPCCQHELHDRLQSELFQPLLRHGILKARMGDLLTDFFRVQILRILGYRTDIVEFVSPDATSRNLLIRARRGRAHGQPALLGAYRALCDFWNVTPELEKRLAGEWKELAAT